MSVRKSVAWAFLGQFISVAVSFTGSVIIARILSPGEVGVYVVALAVLGVIQVVAAFGTGAYVIREPDLTDQVMDTAFTVNAALAVALSLIVFLVSFVTGPLLGDPAAGRVLRVLALTPLIGILTFRPATMLQRNMQFRAIALVSSVSTIVYTLVAVTSARHGFSYMSPAYGGLASALFGVAAYNLLAMQHAGFRLSLADWRPMSVFGFRMMSISGVSVLMARVSDIVVGRLLGLDALGLLSRASSISSLLFENVYGTATRVVFSKLATENRERGEFRETFLHSLRLILGVMWPLLLGLAVVARPTLHLLYGEKWLGAALPLSIMLIGQVLVLVFGMNWELFVLRDETARQTRLEVTRSIVGLVLLVAGCAFGLVGAALGGVAAALFSIWLYFPHMTRLARTPARAFLRIYRDNGLLALAAVSPAAGVMAANGWSAQTPWTWLIAAVAAGVALWLAALVWLRHPLWDELRMSRVRVMNLLQR